MSSLFNGWAFVVLGIAGFFYFALGAVGGSITAGGRGPLALGILIVASAVICEWRGLAGRLMGAPLWIWGSVLALFGLVQAFGLLALAPAVGAGLLGGGVYWQQRRRKKRELWPMAEAALERARDASAAADLGGTWGALTVALELPVPKSPAPPSDAESGRLVAHFVEVAEVVRQTFAPTLSSAQRERLEVLQERLSGAKPDLSSEDRQWLEDLVEHQGI